MKLMDFCYLSEGCSVAAFSPPGLNGPLQVEKNNIKTNTITKDKIAVPLKLTFISSLWCDMILLVLYKQITEKLFGKLHHLQNNIRVRAIL